MSLTIGIIFICCQVFALYALVSLQREILGLKKQRRQAYRHGLIQGDDRAQRKAVLARERELQNARRTSVPRSDAGPPARVTQITFASRKDPEKRT